MKAVFVFCPFSSFNLKNLRLVSYLGPALTFHLLEQSEGELSIKKQQRTLEGCESLKPTTSTFSSSKVELKVMNVPRAVISN